MLTIKTHGYVTFKCKKVTGNTCSFVLSFDDAHGFEHRFRDHMFIFVHWMTKSSVILGNSVIVQNYCPLFQISNNLSITLLVLLCAALYRISEEGREWQSVSKYRRQSPDRPINGLHIPQFQAIHRSDCYLECGHRDCFLGHQTTSSAILYLESQTTCTFIAKNSSNCNRFRHPLHQDYWCEPCEPHVSHQPIQWLTENQIL